MGLDILISSYNGQAAFDELGQKFESVIQSLSDTVLENARANLKGHYPDVEATLQARLMDLATSGLITGQIGSDYWESWLAEWGSGSEMDRDNPDLGAYMGSEYWNPARQGFAITGRPAGEYLGLDGQIHDSTGRMMGVDLEVLARSDADFQAWMAKVGLPTDAFQPKPPLHFMRDAIESNRNLIIDQLNAVLETFRFGDFFM